ncbi:MAG TPA: O-antigen polysaccharide polymerase Wzy [Candidatus Eisenbacteria bacterium]|nr:O-antigen polysaccharide polymerase Wzy [Candidatus Eisenbacteria bacterium]
MSAAAPTWPARDYGTLPIPAAALEVLAYLGIVAGATLAFLAGWLTVNGAVILTVALVTTLVVLSWVHLGQGRHPVFLFLCTLLLFQGGRLVAYCLGSVSDPFLVVVMVDTPFGISRNDAGIVMLCIALSAICIYAPCRWNYRAVPPPSDVNVRQYLPYLYLVFFSSMPFLLYKNYLYYRYIQAHGWYTVFYNDYNRLAASVPMIVRLVALLTIPVLVAIFVFETRKKLLYTVVALYLCSSIVLLLTGTRMGTFGLILTLWYVARIKSTRNARVWRLAVLAAALVVVANLIGLARFGEDVEGRSAIDPVAFVATQGVSLAVTEVAVLHRSLFQPYVFSYLLHELELQLVSSDVSHYFRGRQFGFDVSVFLNPFMFEQGFATSGAYVAESYVIGGIFGVVVISLLIGCGLRFMHACSRNAITLVLVALVLPNVLLMPRGFLLEWGSALIRSLILLVPLALGWSLYHFLTPVVKARPVR